MLFLGTLETMTSGGSIPYYIQVAGACQDEGREYRKWVGRGID